MPLLSLFRGRNLAPVARGGTPSRVASCPNSGRDEVALLDWARHSRASPKREGGPPAGPPPWSPPDALLIEREPDPRADSGDDPELQHDLGLRPGQQLEVVVYRRHQQ